MLKKAEVLLPIHLQNYTLNLKIYQKMWTQRVAGKGFAGGFYGLFGSIAGAGGKTIKVGDGDLQTAAEAGASIFTGIAQAAADSMNSKDSKNNKDGQK